MEEPIWPLFDLEVRTPNLSLRYIDDDLAAQLAELAAMGIHDPASTPFTFPWSDMPPPQLQRNTMQHYWRCRAETTPESWSIGFAVEIEGAVVGTTGLEGDNFPTLRQLRTGSWLGREFQGQGIGKEVRIAALTLAFDGFDADFAVTGAWKDNAASIGVTKSLGYTETGRQRAKRRDQADEIVNFAMDRAHFETIRRDDITLHGMEAVQKFLQTERSARDS